MYRIMTVCLLSLATLANADQPKITETGDSIIVEYTGTPAEKASEPGSPVVAPARNPSSGSRVEYLNAQLERLRNEVDALSVLTGKESEAELRSINEQMSLKKEQIKSLGEELRTLTEGGAGKPSEAARPDNDQQSNQQTRRQEMKKGVRDLQQLRRTTIFPNP